MLTKAKPPAQAQHADQLLTAAEHVMRRAFRQFIDNAREIDVESLLESGGINAVLDALELPIQRFAANWQHVFVEVGNREANSLELSKARQKKPTVTGVFQPGDPEAARLMEQNSLNLVTNLTNEQRKVVRNALVQGLREGLGTRDLAELFRSTIGLTEQQQRSLATFARAQRQARVEELRAGEEFVSTDKQIQRLVQRHARQLQQARAETVARTESLKITTLAREQALRQSARAVGQSEQFIGVEWVAALDSRTREAHRERNGARRRLGEDFAPGISKPGEGGPAEVINCRCQLVYEMFDTEEALQQWLAGGS